MLRTALVPLALVSLLSFACAGQRSSVQAPPSDAEPAATTPSASTAANSFALNPPAGTQFERTATFRSSIEVPGTDLKQAEERIVTVDAKVDRDGDNIRLTHVYKNLAIKLTGVVNLALSGGIHDVALSATVSPQGRPLALEGVESLQGALLELAGPEDREVARQVFSLDNLKLFFLGRYDLMVGDLMGRPAVPGATWEIELAGDPLVSRRILTVQREEPCGPQTCRRVTADYAVNSDAVALMARQLLAGLAVDEAGNVEEIRVTRSEFQAKDSVLVDPATLLYHAAEFHEEGRAQLALGTTTREVVIKRSRTMAYNYQ